MQAAIHLDAVITLALRRRCDLLPSNHRIVHLFPFLCALMQIRVNRLFRLYERRLSKAK